MQSITEINAKYTALLQPYAPFVLGEGDIYARLMLVGEAPGAQEVMQSRPFVGKAGKNLDAFLQRMNLARESIYITNAVKIRPTKQSDKGRLSNRPPKTAEVKLFGPWLQQEIAALSPAVIVTLGNVALAAVCGWPFSIGAMHGKPFALDSGRIVFPLYHPASIIYRRELAATYEKDIDTLHDFLLSIEVE